VISYIITGAACGIIGILSGQGLILSMGRRGLASRVRSLHEEVSNVRLLVNQKFDDLEGSVADIEKTVPDMISRAEVERAFAQVAQIEAQKQAAVAQQARAQAVFGGGNPPVDLNTAINAQLGALSDRMNQINREFGLNP
jgi:hypothetical protein